MRDFIASTAFGALIIGAIYFANGGRVLTIPPELQAFLGQLLIVFFVVLGLSITINLIVRIWVRR